ncbi:DNA/RNA non-specific endonuclease [Streptomyces pristinaespiralis]
MKDEAAEATSGGWKGFLKWGFKTAGKRNLVSAGISGVSALAGVESPTDAAIDWAADALFGDEEKTWVEIDRGADRPPLLPDTGSGGACDKTPKEQRFTYHPMENGTASGATALICPSDLKGANSRTPRPRGMADPPGWKSERDGGAWKYHRTHILGDRFGGEWRADNVFTGFREMNDPGMKRCENRMASALAAQQPVLYHAQLQYGNGRSNLPTSITMTATTPNGVLFQGVVVHNRAGAQVTC